MQNAKPNWTEGKRWLYRGYEVTHARDGNGVEVRKCGGPLIQRLSKPVTYQDLTAAIDKLHVSAP